MKLVEAVMLHYARYILTKYLCVCLDCRSLICIVSMFGMWIFISCRHITRLTRQYCNCTHTHTLTPIIENQYSEEQSGICILTFIPQHVTIMKVIHFVYCFNCFDCPEGVAPFIRQIKYQSIHIDNIITTIDLAFYCAVREHPSKCLRIMNMNDTCWIYWIKLCLKGLCGFY